MVFKHFLKEIQGKSWTIKIISKLKQEASVIHVSGIELLRIGSLLSLAFLIVFGYFLAQKFQETASYRTILATQSRQLKTAEQEKQQAEALLSQKASELELHLNQLRADQNRIQKILEKNPRNSSVRTNWIAAYPYAQFAEKSSRGGTPGLASLEKQISQEEEELNQTQSLIFLEKKQWEKFLVSFSRIPSLWPVDGEITSGFGPRIQPITGLGEFHPGTDIACPSAASVRATAGGKCIFSGSDGGYGLTVKIDHENGFVSQYSHCSRVFPQEGTRIQKGQIIAEVGSTGLSTGPHLHYQLFFRGSVLDPVPYLGLSPAKFISERGVRGLSSPI